MNNRNEGFAKPNYDKLGEAVEPKEMYKGGGQLSPGESGPGIRAGKLRDALQPTPFGLSKIEGKRFGFYRKLLDGVIDGSINDEKAKEKLAWIYDTYQDDLEKGGFLSTGAKLRVVNELEARGEITEKEAEGLRSFFEERTEDKAGSPSVWEQTIETLSKETGEGADLVEQPTPSSE